MTHVFLDTHFTNEKVFVLIRGPDNSCLPIPSFGIIFYFWLALYGIPKSPLRFAFPDTLCIYNTHSLIEIKDVGSNAVVFVLKRIWTEYLSLIDWKLRYLVEYWLKQGLGNSFTNKPKDVAREDQQKKPPGRKFTDIERCFVCIPTSRIPFSNFNSAAKTSVNLRKLYWRARKLILH